MSSAPRDRLVRALRTLIQAVPPPLILAALLAFGVPLTGPQQLVLLPLLTALASFVMNLLEDQGTINLGPLAKRPAQGPHDDATTLPD